jgi:hypothetical protein
LSVTTFTSFSSPGGKEGNVAPTADAGDDMTIEDTEGTGNTRVTVDASASSDADGTITNYSWSLDGQQIAWTATPQFDISIGEYDLVLTVTDNDGATDSDTLHINFVSNNSEEIWLEAECGTVGSSWNILEDAAASDGRYVETPAGYQKIDGASDAPEDLLVFEFEVTEASNYKVWGRVIAPSPDDDSYYVKVDDSPWITWNSIPSGSSWHWDDVHDQSQGNEVFYDLEAGEHTLYICMREDGAKLDKILIANTGTTPEGEGGAAESCTPVGLETSAFTEDPGITVYPNPTDGRITLEWQAGIRDVRVVSLMGQEVYRETFDAPKQHLELQLELEPGIYSVLVSGDSGPRVQKVIMR